VDRRKVDALLHAAIHQFVDTVEQLFQVLTDGTDRWYLVPKTEENLLIRTAGGAAYNSADTDAGPATLGGECRFTLYDSFSGFRDVQGEARGQ
jgi:hypothetical protein